MGKQVEGHDEAEASTKQHYTEKDKSAKELQISSDGLILVNQLKEFIEGTIRSKIVGSSSTRWTVSMVELTSSRQWKEEPIVDYINRWRNLSLNCKDRISEASAIEMCIQSMYWGIRYILQGILSKSFEELAARAHDMELSITTSGVEGPLVQESRRIKENQELKKGGKLYSEAPSKESMAMNIALFKLKSTTKDSGAPKNNISYEKLQRKLTLKEMQAKQYPFLNSMSREYLMTYWRLALSICQK
ncbi:UNVERIFIED_CONTAM: hypothetical protein Scaly_1611100 [Sesamum calycinum]|uniref:Uncharacterized protein n=1 Tax=Sesamum calycinum TaxID=2727403 RepID=A0AAW2PBS1_9LAMI